MKKYILGAILSILAGIAYSQNAEKKVYQTLKTQNPPKIDGLINDQSWESVEWSGDFTQVIPYENRAPSQQTYFKMLYDDESIYILVFAEDTEADKINPILARHDNFSGDRVEVIIDSDYDKQTAFAFTAMASGSKGDEAVSEDGNNWDVSWNPVWELKTLINENGWYAEIKIPLSVLRFGNKQEHIWGLQVRRNLYRKSEISKWQYIPKGSPGSVHLYGELHGIKEIKPKRQIEITPYLLSKIETFEKEIGNPYRTGKKNKFSIGVDGKIGITNDFSLDFTINPDFGQVEADASEVNLTAYESYFSEKRPFFVEGKSIYDFRPANPIVGNNFGSDLLFYSRRIGRKPHYRPSLDENEYIDMPEATKILAAFKLSGKTTNGLSVGLMETITARENAEIDSEGEKRNENVEPLTNYFVARIQKDFNKGKTVLGGMLTSMNRAINNQNLDYLHTASYTSGIDFQHSWKNRTWYIAAKGVFSNVQGKNEALIFTQRSSARYFQREDVNHLSVDSTITYLNGFGSSFVFGRRGQKRWQFQTSLSMKSPGLEFNDLGYMRISDIIHHGTWVGYHIRNPFSVFRNMFFNFNYWTYFDFGGTNLSKATNINFSTRFKNMWQFGFLVKRQSENISTRMLRGGPSVKLPGATVYRFTLSSNGAKNLSFYSGNYNQISDRSHFRYHSFWGGVTVKPFNSLSVSLSSSFWRKKDELQYIKTIDFGDQSHYVLGKFEQETLNFTLRINYTITPKLSVQYYGQPFISKGRYKEYKGITEPHAPNYNYRFHIFDNNELSYNAGRNEFSVDENSDETIDYSFNNPDFDFRQFRSNLVLRWEYLPGSLLYLVWSQERNSSILNSGFDVGDEIQHLVNEYPHNVFLVKLTYRFAF